MDIDNAEIDLISQFRSMRTNDKENLIDEFRRLSNTDLSDEGCSFYLDLANWNLNAALWAYYEYDAPDLSNLPSMKFLCDVTIGEGESVTPNTTFVKTWRIKNTGKSRWPPGCNLKLVNGASLCNRSINIIDQLDANEEANISIELISPKEAGIYQSQYRLYTPTGTPFGDSIWLVLNVEEGGVLGITQQLNNVNIIGNMINSNNNNNNNNLFLQNSNSRCDDCENNQTINHVFNIRSSMNRYQDNKVITSNSIIKNENTDSDDVRPDFYDDMFS